MALKSFFLSAAPMDYRMLRMLDIQEDALELFRRKNQDYGDAFARCGIIGVMVRLEDKLQRFLSIQRRGVTLVNDETLEDTLFDLHNYAAMALMLLRERDQDSDSEE